MDGVLYFLTPMYVSHGASFFDVLWANLSTPTTVFGIPGWVHPLTYIIFFTAICVVFGQFWVETAGMGPKEVAEQLDSSGLQVPGYRRDPRIVEKVLERYIPVITILGSAFVGLLAAMADFTGALGTGTGILLTVGILYRLYEDLEKYQVFSSYPGISAMLGEE
jgi:preprotein translocase subunit SecY